MEKSAPYADPKIDRVQPNSGMRGFQQTPDSYYPAGRDHPSALSKAEGQRHWDQDGVRMTNQWPSHQYHEGQVGNATLSQFCGQMPHPTKGLGKGIEQDLEIGYDDKSSPLTLEALEKKFHDEIMTLAKEESDADAAENARHRERKMEISNQYLEKLSALRDLQAKKRGEFLYKETQERLSQCHHQQEQQQRQRPFPNHYPSDRGTLDPRGYGSNYYPTHTSPADPPGYSGPASVDPQHRGYTPGQYDTYGESSPYRPQVQRYQQEAERKVPTPQGRAYNNTRARNL